MLTAVEVVMVHSRSRHSVGALMVHHHAARGSGKVLVLVGSLLLMIILMVVVVLLMLTMLLLRLRLLGAECLVGMPRLGRVVRRKATAIGRVFFLRTHSSHVRTAQLAVQLLNQSVVRMTFCRILLGQIHNRLALVGFVVERVGIDGQQHAQLLG